MSASFKKKGELMLFTKDYQPSFRIAEVKGFTEFVAALDPTYQLSNRHLISKHYDPAHAQI